MRKSVVGVLRAFAILSGVLLLSAELHAQQPIPMLILSGRNNHDWQNTTPALFQIFSGSKLFTVSVTNRPDTLKYTDYTKFRVVVSNWNQWPDTSGRWSEDQEKAFTDYIRKGGGAVVFHAGGSSFYGWQDYHKIAIGRWGKKTSHGSIGPAEVMYTDEKHPVTKGLKDFSITDEIWENTEIHPGAVVLGTVQKMTDDGRLMTDGRLRTTDDGRQMTDGIPAIMVGKYGKGRSFYTILGHDEKVLGNAELQKLLINGALWVGR
jgi:type 1 glutamine amidotransferase